MDEHKANQAFWDASAEWWQAREDARALWRQSQATPSLVLTALELSLLQDISGRPACVLGSGDNEIAFALAGLGATVTSVDISARRLAVATRRAAELGLSLTFIQADVTDLAVLDSDQFDVVYTGGHVSVWIGDITRFYAEAGRILRPGGLFMVHEYHPIRRMWLDAPHPAPAHSYFDRGPYAYTTDDGLPTYEYHWTVADHVQAVLDGGCDLLRIEEHGEQGPDEDGLHADLRGLPASLSLIARKRMSTP